MPSISKGEPSLMFGSLPVWAGIKTFFKGKIKYVKSSPSSSFLLLLRIPQNSLPNIGMPLETCAKDRRPPDPLFLEETRVRGTERWREKAAATKGEFMRMVVALKRFSCSTRRKKASSSVLSCNLLYFSKLRIQDWSCLICAMIFKNLNFSGVGCLVC